MAVMEGLWEGGKTRLAFRDDRGTNSAEMVDKIMAGWPVINAVLCFLDMHHVSFFHLLHQIKDKYVTPCYGS